MILIEQPRKRQHVDVGDLHIPKYSVEYYRLLWRDGYNNGIVVPKDKSQKFQFHKNRAKRFDKKYGYRYYDDEKKQIVYRRKDQDRIDRNKKRYLFFERKERDARDADIHFDVYEKTKRQNERFNNSYNYETSRLKNRFNNLFNYEVQRSKERFKK